MTYLTIIFLYLCQRNNENAILRNNNFQRTPSTTIIIRHSLSLQRQFFKINNNKNHFNMKKFTLLALAIMASATSFAQTTLLWNGEDKDLNTTAGFWNDGTPELVNNPEKDGINTSSKCIKFTMTNNENKMVKLPFESGSKNP